MKKIILSLLFISSILWADSTVKLSIGGMTCGGCASGINENFLEDLPKYKAHVDFDTAIMTVSTKDGSDVNVKEVEEALLEMDFKGTLVKK